MNTINNYIEHTLLKPDATKKDIERLIKEADENKFFGICINPCYVSFAKDLLSSSKNSDSAIKIVTVVNFPLASNTIDTTLYQTELALECGADEIDTVINISELKNKNYKKVEQDIQRTKEVCKNHNLKVILETDLLSKEEIVLACKCAASAGANFVKTSTGFLKGGIGATVENVKLMYKTLNPFGLEVKASAGIKTYNQAIDLINAGASRLGTSSGVDIMLGEVQNV